MSRVRILDPTAAPPEIDADPGPPAGRLAGRTVGIRLDQTWRSFIYTTEEWAKRLEAVGARVRWWDAHSRVGEQGERTRNELVGLRSRDRLLGVIVGRVSRLLPGTDRQSAQSASRFVHLLVEDAEEVRTKPVRKVHAPGVAQQHDERLLHGILGRSCVAQPCQGPLVHQ